MPQSTRARRLRLLALAAAVGAVIYGFTPKSPGEPGAIRPASQRRDMPDFSLRAVGGGDWRLADHRGQVVLVNFWATWCPPCRSETSDLVAIHKRYASRGFTVIGISMDDAPDQVVPQFVQRFGVPYPMLVPSLGFDLADQVESLPTSFLIDARGRIARTYLGMVDEEGLAADIDALLSEGPHVARRRLTLTSRAGRS